MKRFQRKIAFVGEAEKYWEGGGAGGGGWSSVGLFVPASGVHVCTARHWDELFHWKNHVLKKGPIKNTYKNQIVRLLLSKTHSKLNIVCL